MYAALSLSAFIAGFTMLGIVASMMREREAFKEGV